jgi:hypothetical protein
MNASYESLAYVGRLSFSDTRGLDARYDSYQQIRVTSGELTTVTRHIWGDGDAAYSVVAPAAPPIRTYAAGDKRVVVGMLRRPLHRGDELDIHTSRRIHHGFKGQRQWWEFIAFTPVHYARVAISFPIGREPEGISVGADPGTPSPEVFQPGTKELIMVVKSPVIGARYRIEWSW